MPMTPVFSFADPLYKMLGELLGHMKVAKLRAENRKNEPLPELGGHTLREALQTLGTDWGRNLMWDDIWVQRCIHRIAVESPVVASIDDLRFPNEYARVREAGATIVRLVPEQEEEPEAAAHESEQYSSSFEADIEVRWKRRSELRVAAKYIHRRSLGDLGPLPDTVTITND